MNKKGFTMIELLATIVILSILSIIGIASVNKYVQQSKVRSYKLISESVYEATMNCIIQGKCVPPASTSSKTTYTISELKSYGYLKKVENPGKKNSECTGSVNIFIASASSSEYQNYYYQVNLNCPGLSNATLNWPYSKTADNKVVEKIIQESKVQTEH